MLEREDIIFQYPYSVLGVSKKLLLKLQLIVSIIHYTQFYTTY